MYDFLKPHNFFKLQCVKIKYWSIEDVLSMCQDSIQQFIFVKHFVYADVYGYVYG